MRYSPVSCGQRDAMLEVVGATSADDLFSDVPESVRLRRPLALDVGMSEIDLTRHLAGLARASRGASSLVSFAGAGCCDHHVPAIVDAVLSRPEFFTAYTPYQPEVSQGTLQGMYEYQSMICSLTGMDVANASIYDGATAFVEAALMACRVTRRSEIVVAGTVHPEWRRTLETYAAGGHMRLRWTSIDVGVGLVAAGSAATSGGLQALVSEQTAAVLVSSPNVFGNLEDVEVAGRVAHDAGALLVVSANPILLGMLEPPSACGADIVVGEGQPLGSAMSFGGPGLGFFACRQDHIRQMPGRLVGRTVDADGNDGFVLTLSTREQHIRREKATSNICSNHALNALAAGAYLAAVGAEGLAGIARACCANARYLRSRLLETPVFTAPWDSIFGYEFALRYEGDVAVMRSAMLERGFLAGVDYGELCGNEGVEAATGGVVLLCATEKRTRAEMDAFVDEVASL